MFDSAISAAIDYGNPVNRAEPLNRGLTSWWLTLPQWRGGSTWRDLCGRNHGTLTNMAPATDWVASPRLGGFGALDFDGNDDAVATGLSLTSLGSEGTISCWTYPRQSATAGVQEFLWCAESASSGISFQKFSDNKFYVGWVIAGVSHRVVINASGVWSQNTWQQFTVTWKSGTAVALYRNGVLIGTGGTGAGVTSGTTLTLGSLSTAGSGLSCDGRLDDFRVYNRQLAANEVQQLYNDSRLGYPQTLRRVSQNVAAPSIASISLTADVGAITLDGQAVSFASSGYIVADVGAFAFAGQAANLYKRHAAASYINGDSAGSSTYPPPLGTYSQFTVGARGDLSQKFDGSLSLISVHTEAVAASWVAYHSAMASQGAFWNGWAWHDA